jgi:hypothetical protein
LTDYEEIYEYGTDPNDIDTDDDGILDPNDLDEEETSTSSPTATDPFSELEEMIPGFPLYWLYMLCGVGIFMTIFRARSNSRMSH